MTSLAVHRAGQGGRAALFVHCALADSSVWRGVTRRLAPHLAMRLADLPGHGDSPDWDGQGDLAARSAAGLGRLLDAPTDLVGHSVGAVLLLRLALDRPDLVRSLTLIEPVLFNGPDAPETAAYLDEVAGMKAAVARGDRDAAARRFNQIWGAAGWHTLPDAVQGAQRARIHYIRAFEAALERDSGALLAPGRLETLTAPVLLIQGGASPPLVPVIQSRLAARLPRARQVTIPGAGHMAPVTHPRAVAQEIAGLIRE